MIDPIGAFTRIRDFYISYLETAFSIRNPSVSLDRRRLLEANDSLCAEPIIEPLTRYETARFNRHDWSTPGSTMSGFLGSDRRSERLLYGSPSPVSSRP